MNHEIIGLLAGIFTTFSIVPQLVRVYQLKSAKEISLVFTLCLALGVSLWLIYGIMIDSLPITIWNAISLFLISGLIVAKIKYGKQSLLC